jgi:hypothetical protein
MMDPHDHHRRPTTLKPDASCITAFSRGSTLTSDRDNPLPLVHYQFLAIRLPGSDACTVLLVTVNEKGELKLC